jgi:hypothetical protein
MRRFNASSVSGTALPMRPPSVQSPFASCRCYRRGGRRVPPPERTLLLRRCYYRLMRQTRLALLAFDYESRLRSPCRLLPAPAASGLFPTLSLRIFPMMPGPYHDGLQIAHTCFFLCNSGLPQWKMGRHTVGFRLSDFTAGEVFEIAAISLCSGLTVCLPPWSLLPPRFPAGQLVTFTSGQNVLRYLRTHRIC